MSRVKYQHYVPRFYLSKFANTKNQLHTFDKFEQKSFLKNISNIGGETGFYDLPREGLPEGVDYQVVEKNLAIMEGSFSTTLDGLLRSVDKRGVMYRNTKKDFSPFVAVQFLRTRQLREDIGVLSQRITESFATLGISSLAQIDAFPISVLHLLFAFSNDKISEIARVLRQHIWIVGRNETPQPLITSDNPFVRKEHVKNPVISNYGIRSPGIEIALPLSPKYVLILCERVIHKNREDDDLKVLPLSDDNVLHYNALQIEQSFRQVYSSNDQFDLVKDMCRVNPDLRIPNGGADKRIQVHYGE